MTDYHQLYNKYASDIYRFALYLCGNKAEAEDITAETFVRALIGKAPLVSATVKGYLLTIARNLYFESERRRKRFLELPIETFDASHDLDDLINQKMELADLQLFLQTCVEDERTALMLRVNGLAYIEIANALNISLASAKVKVHWLRMKLAQWRLEREQIN